MMGNNIDQIKMETIQKALKQWQKDKRKEYLIHCPVCGHKDRTLIIKQQDGRIYGICMNDNCNATGRIYK